MGASGGLFGSGRLVVHQGSGGTGQLGLCRRLLRHLVRICRCDHQCPTLGRNHFLFPIRLRAGLLRLSHDPGGRGRGSLQNAQSRSLFDSCRVGRVVCCIFVGDEGICDLYWAVHCAFETSPCGVPGPFLLHIFGVDGIVVLRGLSFIIKGVFTKCGGRWIQ